MNKVCGESIELEELSLDGIGFWNCRMCKAGHTEPLDLVVTRSQMSVIKSSNKFVFTYAMSKGYSYDEHIAAIDELRDMIKKTEFEPFYYFGVNVSCEVEEEVEGEGDQQG